MKKKHNEGFSLVEVLVAISILALIVIPTCSGIIMSFRMNAKADELMQAQLAVSSAVETLMAEGIEKSSSAYDVETVNGQEIDRFPNVEIVTEKTNATDHYYKVTVTSSVDPNVSVTTSIRAVDPEGGST